MCSLRRTPETIRAAHALRVLSTFTHVHITISIILSLLTINKINFKIDYIKNFNQGAVIVTVAFKSVYLHFIELHHLR